MSNEKLKLTVLDSSLYAWRTEINMCSLPPKPVVAQTVIHTCLTRHWNTNTEIELTLSLLHNPTPNDKHPAHLHLPSHDDY